MESLADLLNQDSRLSKSLNTFQNREYWAYTCPHCEARVEPRAVETESGVWYSRGECQCADAVAERKRQIAADLERREALRAADVEAQRTRAGLAGALAKQTFETFERKFQPEAYDTALSFFDHPRSLVFAGRVNGLGKTHLMAAIANRCIEKGKSVRFGTLAEYLSQIRATYNEQALVTTERYVEQLTRCYLLCIDDLGKERLTDWGREQLFLIVNARYNLRPEGHVILTSNAEGQGLAASMGVHNWSRMQEVGTVVYMKGSDYRLRGRK